MQLPLQGLQQIGYTPESFAAAVQRHIDDLHAFAKTEGKPRPLPEHPVIEQCIKRTQHNGWPDTYEPDYELFDDTPKLTLEEKKQRAAHQVAMAEAAALERIVPNRKRRLWQMKNTEVRAKLAAVEAKPRDSHTSADREAVAHCNAALDAVQAVEDKFRVISMRAAQAEAAIEDLTEDNIDSWQCPSFD